MTDAGLLRSSLIGSPSARHLARAMVNKYLSWPGVGWLKSHLPGSLSHQQLLSSVDQQHKDALSSVSYSPVAGITMKNLFTAVIAGTQYLLHPQKLGTIEETINPDALIPVTLLTTSEIDNNLDGILHLFATVDDVFQPTFGDVIVEKPEKNGTAPNNATLSIRSARVAYSLHEAGIQALGFDELPSGPYFLHGPNLYQAWRLYEDNLDAFTFGVIPESINGSSDAFEALSSLSDSGSFKSVGVPSRLYFPKPSIRKPLSGVRMSITDAMSLKGVQTTLSSRAWTQLHDTASIATADYVMNLIDLGAVIVGKTKSSQFDSGREWVDQEAPWNPRGDGYQSPAWSAAGAGASLAGYDWMEYSIAQDALEGTREQGSVSGLYSIRSTAGSVALNGWQISSSHYDSAGLLSRSLSDLLKIAQPALNISNPNNVSTKRLLYPLDFYPMASKDHQALDDKFVGALEGVLGTKAQKIRLADIWTKKPPTEVNGQSLEEYMKQSPFGSFCYDFYHEYDDFRNAYKNQFGSQPYIEDTPRFRWGVGEQETKEVYDEYLKRIDVFRKWFNENIMSTVADSDTIMVLPFGSHDTIYRDDSVSKPTAIDGVTSELLAPLLEVPQFIAPFAQLPYLSKVTGKTEYRPICGSVIGPKGSEVHLIQLMQKAFLQAKWLTTVAVGRSAFPENYKPA